MLEFVEPAAGACGCAEPCASQDPASPELLRLDDPRSVEVLQEREYVRIRSARPVLVYTAREAVPGAELHRRRQRRRAAARGPGDAGGSASELKFRLTLTPGVPPVTGTGRVVRVDAQGRRAVAFDATQRRSTARRLVQFIFECQRAERRRGLDRGRR